ncbi:peptidase M24 family protein [Williamsia sp. 1138]|uniref:M24 family metallopeptidase n=1 Tax=Williamsia sp. 1138 TaxID=1903117 RepID=UPI000A10271E|nr:Xaa-Pro peptidase family protein [Williamsia sp. 1138]OZG28565.1 peptidase M24 family protein [Williamsia sp. 1138]
MVEQRFSASVYRSRLERAQKLTAEAGLTALFITPGPDLRYLTGSRAATFERLTVLVLSPHREAQVIVPRLELAALRESAVGELGLPIHDWVDGQDPYDLATAALGDEIGRYAVSDVAPALHTVPLAARIGSGPELATAVLRDLRMVKDQAEIDSLREAGAAIDRVHARVGEWLKAGRTESEVAADIKAAIVAEGHTGAEFIIVGSGPNGADPHHEVSDRVIEDGDVVVVDIGGPVEPGYNSDCTRTYCVGTASSDVAEQYAILQQAQAAAVAAVRPGVRAEQIDAAARDILVDAGLGEQFVHRTGHGIGLSVHEEPYIVSGNDLPLAPGMAFSIEPGIYFPGSWGARIEDIVIVTEDGCEPLNRQPHELRYV